VVSARFLWQSHNPTIQELRNLEIGISTWSMGSPMEALERIAEARFKHAEIWADPYGVLDCCLDVLVLALEEYDLDASSLHAPFTGLDISSTNQELRSLSINKILDTIETAEKLDCKHVIVHPSSGKYDITEDHHNAQTLLARSTEKLAKKADEKGLTLALENMLASREGLRVGTTVAELRECLESLPAANVGICLDTGHAHYNGLEVSNETKNAGNFLTDLHVDDNDRSGDQHKVPGEGTINWQSFMRALKDTAYSGTFMLEICGEDQPRKILEHSYKAASRLLDY